MERKLLCNISENGRMDARFVGGPITKRELLQVVKAVRLAYRQKIRLYRQELGAKRAKAATEAAKKVVAEKLKKQEVEQKDLGVKEDDRDKITSENQSR